MFFKARINEKINNGQSIKNVKSGSNPPPTPLPTLVPASLAAGSLFRMKGFGPGAS